MRIRDKFVKIALYVGAAFCCTTFAFAQDADGRYVLRIEGGKLGKAVDDVHEQTNLEFIYSFDLVDAGGINPVSGKYTLDEALTIMFEGTGLSGGLTESGMIVIARDSSLGTQTQGEDNMVMNNIKKSLLVGASALVISGTQAAFAQEMSSAAENPVVNAEVGKTGTITGRVTYAGTDAPLIGAIVDLIGTNLTAVTNSRGEYRFPVAPTGTFTVYIDYLGTESQSSNVTVRANTKAVQNFSLGKESDEIIVTAQRSSLMQALNQQRSADNNSTVISSDLIGAFPAETIAEALRRVPGVGFERDDASGEGTKISVRGFNAEAVNIKLNGLPLQGTGISRAVDLTGFLTENISQVIIHKTLLPSHESDSSGGLVELETKSGLDYGDKFFSVGLERETGFAGGFGSELQASVTGAYKITDNLGVAASLQYRDTNRENYDIGILQNFIPVLPAGVTFSSRIPFDQTFPFDVGIDQSLLTGGNYTKRQRDETNLTGSLNFAYDVADHTTLRLDLQHIEAESTQLTQRATIGYLARATDMPIPELGGEVRRRSYIYSLRPTLGLNDITNNLKTTSISFRGDTVLDAWDVGYSAGYSSAITLRKSSALSFVSDQNINVSSFISPSSVVTNPDDNAAMTQRIVGGAVSLVGDGIPSLNLTTAGQDFLNDPGTYYLISGSRAEARNPTDAYFGGLNVRRNFNHKNIDYIEIGGRYDDSTRANSDDVLSNTNLLAHTSLIRNFGRPRTYLPDLLPGTGLSSTNLSLIGAEGLSVPALGAGISDAAFAAALARPADFNLTDRTGNPIDVSGAISPSVITEETIAAYFETKLKFGDFNIVGGVRYERNNRASTSISTPSFRAEDGTVIPRDVFVDTGLISFIDTGGVQATWTPSLLATYRPTEQIVARLGYNRSTVNPDFRLLIRPSQVFIDLRQPTPDVILREANPDLVPSITDNYDVDLAYYFKDNPGLIRAGFFYKKVSNNFTNVTFSNNIVNADVQARVDALLQPLQGVVDPALLVFPANTEYLLNRPTNGEGGEVYGFELEVIRQLDFLPSSFPAFTENFSVLSNLTYVTSDFETSEFAYDPTDGFFQLSLQRPLTSQSAWAGNASLRYEDGGFSGSMIYTIQSASASDYSENNLNVIRPTFSTLDARVSYVIENGPVGSQIVLFMEGDDLLTGAKTADTRTATSSQFGDGSAEFFFPRNLQFSGGRTFTVGAKVRF